MFDYRDLDYKEQTSNQMIFYDNIFPSLCFDTIN